MPGSGNRRRRPAMAGIIASLAVILLLVLGSILFVAGRDTPGEAEAVPAPE